METPKSLLRYGTGKSGVHIASSWKLPTNCLTKDFNKCRDENGEGKCSSLAKIPFPTFDGEQPEIWKAKCLAYFHDYDISKCMWVIAAAMHMEGKAKDWWLRYKMQHELGSWNQFMDAVLEKFAATEGSSAQAEKIMSQAPTNLQQVLDRHSSLTQPTLGRDNQMQYKQTNFNAKTQAKAAEVVWDEQMHHKETVWDDQSFESIDSHDGLLQQLAQGVIDDMHYKDIMWDDALEQDHGAHGGLLQLLADGGEYPSEECPEEVVDEMPTDFALHGGSLKRLASGTECISDKKANQAVKLDTCQPSAADTHQEGSSILFLPSNKSSNSFGDFESLELNMSKAQIGKNCFTLTVHLINGWNPYLPQSDEIKTLVVLLEQSMQADMSLQRSPFSISILQELSEKFCQDTMGRPEQWCIESQAYGGQYVIERNACFATKEFVGSWQRTYLMSILLDMS